MLTMREIARALLLVGLLFNAVPALANPEAVVTPLVAKDLPEFQGKEGVMILVEYPPGASDPIHRHDAHAFVYVLEGSIVMQLRDAAEVTLWTDLLRGSQRRSLHGPECKRHAARQIRRI